ncbi:RNA-directed DNA polymerase, eukaryota [Tanacetum coccineum]
MSLSNGVKLLRKVLMRLNYLYNKLLELDKTLDKGGSNDEILINRCMLIKELHDLNLIKSLEIAQKAKIHRKFFNGVEGSDVKNSVDWLEKYLASKNTDSLGAILLIEVSTYCLSLKKVGNGEDTLFWDEIWLDKIALKHQYPRLYTLESHKQISVAAKMRNASLDFYYRCAPKGGVEEEQQLNLLSRTTDLLLPYMLHHWFWSLEASGDFLVKSVCNLIDDILLPKEEVPTRCVNVIPIKINVFAWRLRLDKLPTRLNLSIRGLKIPSILCLLCSILVESTSHIFFSCSLARQVRSKVNRWWELDDPDIHSYEEWLLCLITFICLSAWKRFLKAFAM